MFSTSRAISWPLALFITFAATTSFVACAPPDDPNSNATTPSDRDMGADQDKGEDMAPRRDLDVVPDMFIPPLPDMGEDLGDEEMSPDMPPTPEAYPKPAEVLNVGDRGKTLLRGTVLTPEGVLDPGEVLIVGGVIACVEQSCEAHPEQERATIIDTHGIISPGLIDAHNHVAYNFLPEWVPPAGSVFTNRYQWADDPSYEAHIAPYANNRSSNTHFCPAARWGELRSVLHGTTTMMGQSFARNCTRGGVRNADQHHELDYHDHMRTSIGSVRDINDQVAAGLIEGFRAETAPDTRYAVHMGEGYEGDHIEQEFLSFAGRDPRPNRHQGVSLLEDGAAILIHAIALTDEELQEAKQYDAKVVWSPSSNLALYKRTADISRILELGITTGLGPDWTLSGEDDMLAELRFALTWAQENAAMRINPLKLWEMSTSEGAEVVGLANFIGELVPGQMADVTVFRRRDSEQDPYEQAITSQVEDVRLVMIGGEAHVGDETMRQALARRDDCDTIKTCGVEKFVCVRYDDNESDFQYDTVSEIEGELVAIMEGTPDFAEDEQYGRGDELLALFACE